MKPSFGGIFIVLSNNCTKNYWNRATTVKVIVVGWLVYFFATQCRPTHIYIQNFITRTVSNTRPKSEVAVMFCGWAGNRRLGIALAGGVYGLRPRNSCHGTFQVCRTIPLHLKDLAS